MDPSLAEQLANIKLKPSKEKTKDFSDPKLAGFINKEEISIYQQNVVKANIEEWQKYLSEETFATNYFPLNQTDAEYFIRIFEKYFQKLYDSQSFDEIKNQMQKGFQGDQDENQWLENLREKLQILIDENYPNKQGFFAKTSSRSAKDAVIFRQDFIELYQKQISINRDKTDENSRIKSLLNAAFLSLRFSSALDLLQTFLVSERIYQDMLLITEIHRSSTTTTTIPFKEHFIFRPFIFIDIDMEFRGFVFETNLTCLSQYNYLIYSSRLTTFKDEILDKICLFFNETVRKKLFDYSLKNYVIDFALTKSDDIDNEEEDIQSMKVWVIEINPFLETTDGALFSWLHERHIIEQKPFEKTHFRLNERSRPGSWSMLPISIRHWIQHL